MILIPYKSQGIFNTHYVHCLKADTEIKSLSKKSMNVSNKTLIQLLSFAKKNHYYSAKAQHLLETTIGYGVHIKFVKHSEKYTANENKIVVPA